MRKIIPFLILAPVLFLAACGDPPSARSGESSTVLAESNVNAEQQRLAEEARQAEQARLRSAIESVLAADAQTGAITNRSQRVLAMKAIDTADCPPEFRQAYLDHIYAWASFAQADASLANLNSDENVGGAIAGEVISGLFDLNATPIADHLQEEKRLQALRSQAGLDINSSFHEVERIATLYGATLPV